MAEAIPAAQGWLPDLAIPAHPRHRRMEARRHRMHKADVKTENTDAGPMRPAFLLILQRSSASHSWLPILSAWHLSRI
jgi:hypothetical protein